MGRYAGEEYEDKAPCPPEKHQWGMNLICFVCRHSKESLLREAERIIELNKRGQFGKYSG